MRTFTQHASYGCVAHRTGQVAGFTLIELLVVLVLIGMTLALSIPKLDTWLASTRASAERAEVVQAIRNLMIRTRIREEPFELTSRNAASPLSDGQPALALPLGWRLSETIDPWAVPLKRPCEEATLKFVSEGGATWIRVEKQTCRVSVLRSDSAPAR
jgi:prepilin-type N-terminal cleavage/methylation domain-containing protein